MFEELTLKQAQEVMRESAPIVDKDWPLSEVIDRTERYKTDRAILVEEKRIRGIMTYRDVIFKLGTARTKQATPSGMHVSSFMNEPVRFVRQNEPLLQALKIMDEHGFTSVPVVDSEDRPLGIISRWELASLLVDHPTAVDTQVKDVMRSFPASVNLQHKIVHARQVLFQHNISVIPVFDNGEFIGVIGVDEILDVFLKYYELSRGEPKRITPLKFVTVASAVRLRPPKATPEASVAEVANKMLEKRYRAVVIVDDGLPVGYVTGLELATFILKGV